jgi:hypothetical protein
MGRAGNPPHTQDPSQVETEKGWADLKTFQTRKAAKTDAKFPQSDRDQARRPSCVDLSVGTAFP